ncbi:hypothetical protein BDV97DRAFT_291061 [Delphinella strobiligena]|nr:hypothetical protein BDV97DRAFT_291061 [Delphinella strobiligena]
MIASYHSACSLVLSSNSSFIRFWNSDPCRENLLSYLPRSDLVNLRLVCVDFSNRLAPGLFESLSITFRSRSFSRPASIAALDRIGRFVTKLDFKVQRTQDSLLPPLIDPWTGEERSFVYPPQVLVPTAHSHNTKHPKYGDWATTDLLIKQYPPLFHAATNVDAFTRALSTFDNISHLTISCSGNVSRQKPARKTIVDYALISLRLALERASLKSLNTMTLLHIDAYGLASLTPMFGIGASPSSTQMWSRIKVSNMQIESTTDTIVGGMQTLHDYIQSFPRLERLAFCWLGDRGPSPIPPDRPDRLRGIHRGAAQVASSSPPRPPTRPTPAFPYLTNLSIENAFVSASQIRQLISAHSRTLVDLSLESISVTGGTWDEALEPLGHISRGSQWKEAAEETGDVPIMLASSLPRPGLRGARSGSTDAVRTRNPHSDVGGQQKAGRRMIPSCSGIVGENGATKGVRSLLSGSNKPIRPKQKKKDFWACQGVLQAVKGGFLGWRWNHD